MVCIIAKVFPTEFFIFRKQPHSPGCQTDTGAYELNTADFTRDGIVNRNDVKAFVLAFNANDPDTDINGYCIIDQADALAFRRAYLRHQLRSSALNKSP